MWGNALNAMFTTGAGPWGSMLLTLAAILLVAWFIGLVSSYTLGGFIHLLLLFAIVIVLLRLIQGEKPIA